MPVVVNRHQVDPAHLDAWEQGRADLVEEHEPTIDADGTLHFSLRTGPMHEWERTVRIEMPRRDATEPPATTTTTPVTTVTVTETVHYRLAVGIWSPLFSWALRRRLRGNALPTLGPPWWAPPEVLDARASTVLSVLCVLGLFAGYLGTLLTQTITYAAEQFGASTSQQGTLLAGVRVGVLLSLVIVAAADRRGRRAVLLAALLGSCTITALGALAPGMVWLGASQTLARALSTVVVLLIAIIAVEEMPAGCRAFAVSLLAMTAALGAGLCVANLLYADVSVNAWRGAYLVPLLALVPLRALGRRLPETRRFEQHHHESAEGEPHVHIPFDRGRFALLAVSGFCWALFVAPAAQFLNEYLRDERGFTGVELTLFVLATNTPGGIGIIVGGRLAERRGRRLIGIIGVVGGVTFTVMTYLLWGWPLWAASAMAAVIGAMAIPALGVYGPELFPTNQRGKANGGLAVVSVLGSSIGLLAAGWLSDRLGGLGPAMALLALGPAVLVILIAVFYPETAHRELEDINPTDRD